MKSASLVTRLRASFAFVVVGMSLVVGGAVWLISQQAMRNQLRRDVVSATSFLEGQLATRRKSLELQCRLVAEQPSLRAILLDPAASTDKDTVRDRLQFFCESVGADGLKFTYAESDVVVAVGIVPDEGDSHEFKGSTGDSVSPSGRGLVLGHQTPVQVGAQVLGEITAYTEIGMQEAKSMARSLGAEVAFVLDGRALCSSISLRESLPNDLEFHRITLSGRDFGSQQIILRKTESGRQLRATIFRDESEAIGAFRGLQNLFLFILPIATLLAIGVGSRVASSITRPLRQVVRAARQLQDGEWPETLNVDRDDEIGLLTSVFNETSRSLKASQERLLAMIDSDPLSGLMNHRRFLEVLDQEVLRAKEFESHLSLLIVDIDDFKPYNERHGFAEGDARIVDVAQAIEYATPDYITIARFGGDVFTVLLPNCSIDRAETAGEAIRAAVQSLRSGLTVSVGCAEFGVNTSESSGLLLAAELAASRAQHLGKNRVCRFDSVPGADDNADPAQLHRFIQDGSIATIQALAAAVDAKDAYTQGHSQRVAEYAANLARFVGSPRSEVDLIFRTGTLHDVGKIGIPDAILKKPGRLTDEERAVMETHPVLGELIVRKAPQLADTIPGVRHHHEAYDGRGYPDGLVGEAIPFMARVLAIADTFDAMTSDRPYRKGLSVEIALAEIEKSAGTQFDPFLARAFVDLMSGERAKAA
ncbi:MAG TPA: diguanylate cyclase [Fimbriimonadaceae bacterium]|nr:diguanylate cyclase [Fimbriimonadaceae bacterium]